MSAYTEISGLYDRVFDRFEGEDLISKAEVLQMIAAAPLPAADVVEVVRCKNCAVPHNRFTGCPNLNGLVPNDNHFCSYGRKKEGVK